MKEKEFALRILGDKAHNMCAMEIKDEIKAEFKKEFNELLDKYDAEFRPDDECPCIYFKNMPTVIGVFFPNHLWLKNLKK